MTLHESIDAALALYLVGEESLQMALRRLWPVIAIGAEGDQLAEDVQCVIGAHASGKFYTDENDLRYALAELLAGRRVSLWRLPAEAVPSTYPADVE